MADTGLVASGPEDSPTLVFLHGASANLAMWGPVISHLDSEYRCVAIDLPGHGELRDEPFTLEAAAERALEASAGTGQAFLVGLSLGGYVAVAAARRDPGALAGLVLSGTGVEFQGATAWVNRFQGLVLPVVGPLLRRPATKAVAKIAGEDVANTIDARGHSFKGAGQALRNLAGRDFHAMIADYPGPVLMLHGERDKHNIEAMPAFIEGLADVQTEIIPDSGHSCAMSQPAAFAAAVAAFVSGSTG